MGICIQELEMERKMAQNQGKGFSQLPHHSENLPGPNVWKNAVQEHDEKCAKWEKWHQDISTSFCPRIEQLIRQNHTFTIADLVHRNQPRIFSKFMLCKYMDNRNFTNFQAMWHSVCVTVSQLLILLGFPFKLVYT